MTATPELIPIRALNLVTYSPLRFGILTRKSIIAANCLKEYHYGNAI